MAKQPVKEKSLISAFLKPFSYIFIGAVAVVQGTIDLFMYICEGSYYALNALIINPGRAIGDVLLNLKDSLTPRQVKKEKEFKIDVNFDEKGELKKSANSASPSHSSKISNGLQAGKSAAAMAGTSSVGVANSMGSKGSTIVKPLKSSMSSGKASVAKMVSGSNYSNKNAKAPNLSTEKKDIYSQMQNNRQNVNKISKREQKKINAKQKQRLDQERNSLLKMITEGQEKRLEKPQTFRYKAMTPDGKIETSTFIGVSKLDIYTFLTGEGYTVFSIETSNWINFVYGQSLTLYRRMSTKDLIFFITQLATYIKSGITLTEAMRILSRQLRKNKKQHRITQSIVYYLTMGESFSSALDHQTGAFPPLVINMIRAAEAAGNLDETLDDLMHYYEELNATHKQMISAISYPALVGCFSIVIIIFIMIKIVPQFVGIYNSAGATLNPLTSLVINFSNFLRANIGILLLLIGSAIVGIVLAYKKVRPFRRQVQIISMKIPILDKIIIYNELTIFTKTFASLLRNDVFITDSMDILSKITNNEIYKEIMVDTITNIARGDKISDSFKDHWAIPEIAYYMIVTGENTGQLAEMMKKVSDYYQEQHRTIVNSLKAMIEPLLIIFLAVVVGGVLIAVVLPMFELYNEIT